MCGIEKEVLRSLTLISQLGVSVMVPVFMCLGIGLFIDKRFDTSTTVWLLFLGIAAGGRNAYILARQVLNENAKESSDRYKKYYGKELKQDENNKS